MFIKPQLGANFAQTAQPRLFDSLAIRRVASILILLSVTPTCLAFDINSYVPSGELVGLFWGRMGGADTLPRMIKESKLFCGKRQTGW